MAQPTGSTCIHSTGKPFFDPREFGPFSFVENLGLGAYGDVISAQDERTKQKVAIKKTILPQQHPRHMIRTLREIHVLSRLKDDGITNMYDWWCTAAPCTSNASGNKRLNVYIVQSLMTTNLACLFRNEYCRDLLTSEHKRWITYQILRAVKYIHSANLIHRDLKPTNILINEACQIKICDFNMVRVANCHENGASHHLTINVQVLFYRAPEILFWCSQYDQSLDIWSVGCILGELLTGKVLFPGASAIDQLRVVIETMGAPTEEEAEYLTSIGARIRIASPTKTKVESKNIWVQRFPNADAEALDLLNLMLKLAPRDRVTAGEALKHSYVAPCRLPETEVMCEQPFERELDVSDWTAEELQKLLLQWHMRYQAKDANWDSTKLDNVQNVKTVNSNEGVTSVTN